MKKYRPLVSVIVIEYKKQNPYLTECLEAIRRQTYTNFEIIVVSDYPFSINIPKCKIYDHKGKYVPPAKKRDQGAKLANGEILSFIDDDAFPHKDWLKHIVPHFKNSHIVGVGGPGITPPGVSWQEEASGWASASPVGAGTYTYRFLPGRRQFVDDYPSMNLSVRKDIFLSVGGFDSNYYPGEDTKLCLDLTKDKRNKIIYEPKAKVFHHRRPIFKAHLKQNGNFGLHRGYFAKVLPKTSFRIIYFLPSLMLLGLLYSSVIIFSPIQFPTLMVAIVKFGFILFVSYLLSLVINAIWIYSVIATSNKFRGKQSSIYRGIIQGAISIPIIFITHLWYGARFIQGCIFTDKLIR